jgi:hypothetical protein
VQFLFRGMNKGNTQLTSPLGNEDALLMAEKAVVGSLKKGVGRVSVSEGMSKLIVGDFTFDILPLVHETGPRF